jgi:hypothetical protein
MSNETDNPADTGSASAPADPSSTVVPKRPLSRRIVVWTIELLLIAIIIGLLVATWLPAIIGANPDASRDMPLP